MDSTVTLATIEQLYGQVLDLTREQARRLAGGQISDLPTLLSQKTNALGRAQALTAELQQSGTDLTAPECQEVLGRIAELLRQIMEAEERCRTLVPDTNTPPKVPNRAAAAAAYGKGGGLR